MSERRLATVETIAELGPIEGADAIERARVRGWDVVVKKGEFGLGDRVVYIEVDSFLSVGDPRFAFLAARGVKKDVTGAQGHVLKTARLRGQYSQGIAFPVGDFPEVAGASVGADVSEALGIVKWDPPIPAELTGTARGAFPGRFRKSDEERIENLAGILAEPGEWVATEKIDGTSLTAWVTPGDQGVASRNLDLVESDTSTMWQQVRTHDLHAKLREAFGPDAIAAVQGELFGPGVQGNPLQVPQVQLRLFTVQVDGRELPRSSWPAFAIELSVPVHDLPYPGSLDEARAQVDGLPSRINSARPVEDLVWRRLDSAETASGERASWKVVSRQYLLKHDR